MRSLKDKIKLIKRAIVFIHKGEPRFFLICAIQGIFTALQPFIGYWFSAQIVNQLLANPRSEKLFYYIGAALAAGFFSSTIGNGLNQYRIALSTKALDAKEMERNKKLMELDYAYLEDAAFQEKWSSIKMMENTGGRGFMLIIFDAFEVCEQMAAILIGLILFLPLAFKPTQSGLIWNWADRPQVVLLFAFYLAFYMFFSEKKTKKSRERLQETLNEAAHMNTAANYVISQLMETEAGKDLRIYQQQQQYNFFLAETTKLAKKVMDTIARLQNGALPLLNLFLVLLMGAGYYWILLKAVGGAVPAGSVIQYAGAFSILIDKLPKLASNFQYHLNNDIFLEKTFDLIDVETTQYKGTLPVEKRQDREYALEVRNVTFAYPGTERPILKNINLQLVPGERLAVVGRNGSGKTTFIKLLNRLYDPTEGEILLNDIAIQKYEEEEYLSLFSVVFQDFKLFSFKLGQNIAASETVDEKRALDAIRKAGFQKQFEKLKNGFDTFLHKDYDETGVEVSGGEAQKIAMARSIYKDAPIVILDEPTAALDPVSEFEIYQNFADVIADRTAILISHRLSSTRFCDRIAVFDEGEIVQLGTHEELLKDKRGIYAELWNAQAEYYQKEDREREFEVLFP